MNLEEFRERAAGLSKRYQPSEAVLERLSRITLVATVGPAGVGKTTLMKESGWPRVVGLTTRRPRTNEVPGVDYHFRSDYDELIAELERRDFVQACMDPKKKVFYATSVDSYPEAGIATLSAMARGLRQFQRLGFAKLIPIYITADYSDWMARLHQNESHPDEIKRRLVEAEESLQIATTHPDDFIFVHNNHLPTATRDLRAAAEGNLAKEKTGLARAAAFVMLKNLREQPVA